MPALSLDHWNVYCKDLKATVRFYERYVGLTDGDRPPFNFPGAWLYAGEKPILHLVSETGRKRRIYHLTRAGRRETESWRKHWLATAELITDLLAPHASASRP